MSLSPASAACACSASSRTRGVRAAGLRDQRRVARHLAHCQACRRHAYLAGVDLDRPAVPAVAPRRGVPAAAGVPAPALGRQRGGRPDPEPAGRPAGRAVDRACRGRARPRHDLGLGEACRDGRDRRGRRFRWGRDRASVAGVAPRPRPRSPRRRPSPRRSAAVRRWPRRAAAGGDRGESARSRRGARGRCRAAAADAVNQSRAPQAGPGGASVATTAAVDPQRPLSGLPPAPLKAVDGNAAATVGGTLAPVLDAAGADRAGTGDRPRDCGPTACWAASSRRRGAPPATRDATVPSGAQGTADAQRSGPVRGIVGPAADGLRDRGGRGGRRIDRARR